MSLRVVDEVAELYGVENWGGGYFHVNRSGHLSVRPVDGDKREVDVFEIVQEAVAKRRLTTPLVVRFPQILGSQLMRLCHAYETAAQTNDYKGEHFPVFPIKVNPRREVLSEFLKAGASQHIGLECGSRSELCAVLSLEQPPESLLIFNGFKDEALLRLALQGTRAGKQVVVVLKKLNELRMVIRLCRELDVEPLLGLRAKLYSRGTPARVLSVGVAEPPLMSRCCLRMRPTGE